MGSQFTVLIHNTASLNMHFDSVDQKYKFLSSPLKHSSSLDPKWGSGCGLSKLFIQFHFKQGKEMT